MQSVRNLLCHIKEVSYFFKLTPTRQQKLEEHIKKIVPLASKKKLKDVCRTHWIDKVHGMDTFQELFIPVVSCLEEMSLNINRTFNHTTSTITSSLLKLITGFDFVVALCITINVFDITLPVTRLLQAKSNDIYNGLNLIQALIDAVSSLRNIVDQHHQMCYEQALKIAHKINVTEEKPRTSFITKCYKALVLVPTKMMAEIQCSCDTNWKDHVTFFNDFYINDLPNPLALLGELDLWEAYWLNFKT